MRFLRSSLLLFMVALAALVGCRQDDTIEKYTVTHAEREPIHLRVAIMEHGPFVWFFRLSGPESLVKDHVEAFNTFVKSVRFDDTKEPPITWTEPKTWKKDPPVEQRYAGFRIDTKTKQLEVTVTKLPAEGYDLMRNVHRWQKQVNLPLAESKADLKTLVKDEEVGNQQIAWVDMKGLGVHTVSKIPQQPVAAGGRPKFLPLEKAPELDLPFTYVLPAGWAKQKPRSALTRAFFVVGDRENPAEVTLTALRGDGGGLAQNINRWRKEVKLPEAPPDEIVRSADTLPSAGVKAFYVDLDNPRGPAGKNRTLAVILPLGPESWFVKMIGPRDLVGENKNAFETFVKSFKLDAR